VATGPGGLGNVDNGLTLMVAGFRVGMEGRWVMIQTIGGTNLVPEVVIIPDDSTVRLHELGGYWAVILTEADGDCFVVAEGYGHPTPPRVISQTEHSAGFIPWVFHQGVNNA